MRLYALILYFSLTLEDITAARRRCPKAKGPSGFNSQQKLLDQLHSKCDVSKPPSYNNSIPFKVALGFILQRLTYSSSTHALTLLTWADASWVDDRLTYDSKNYGGLKEAVINFHIWQPRLKLLNGYNENHEHSLVSSSCSVNSSGKVHCITMLKFQTRCAADLNNWPYDRQLCLIKLTPKRDINQAYKMVLELQPRAMSMTLAEYGVEWDIMHYHQEIDLDEDAQLTMSFSLVRRPVALAVAFIYPTVVLTVLSLVSLLLDARRKVRQYIIVYIIAIHLYLLNYLISKSYTQNESSPRIILYIRGSVMMTTAALILTLASARLCKKEAPCPNWMVIVNSLVYSSRTRKFIWPRWSTNVTEHYEILKGWTDFTNIVNCLWNFVSILVYVSLYCTYVPKPLY